MAVSRGIQSSVHSSKTLSSHLCVCIHLSVSVCVSIYLSGYQALPLSLAKPIRLSIRPSVCIQLSLWVPTHLWLCLSMCPSLCVSICLSLATHPSPGSSHLHLSPVLTYLSILVSAGAISLPLHLGGLAAYFQVNSNTVPNAPEYTATDCSFVLSCLFLLGLHALLPVLK